jgi:hypothetical protein
LIKGFGVSFSGLFDQPDDDAVGAADVAVPVDVPVLRHLAHEFGALGAMLVAIGVWNVDSSTVRL